MPNNTRDCISFNVSSVRKCLKEACKRHCSKLCQFKLHSMSTNLAAVIFSHIHKHETGFTSSKHDATTARSGHCSSFDLASNLPPGHFSFSHSASRRKKSSWDVESKTKFDVSLESGRIFDCVEV